MSQMQLKHKTNVKEPTAGTISAVMISLKGRSGVACKIHQPGLFCFTHAKNAADGKYPIYCILRSKLHSSDRALNAILIPIMQYYWSYQSVLLSGTIIRSSVYSGRIGQRLKSWMRKIVNQISTGFTRWTFHRESGLAGNQRNRISDLSSVHMVRFTQ